MFAKKYFFFGFKGKFQFLGTLNEAGLVKVGGHSLLTPIIESGFESESYNFRPDNRQEDQKYLEKYLTDLYVQRGNYGPFGDVIEVSAIYDGKNFVGYNVNKFGKRAFPKPGLAADLVLFITDRNGNKFFVGIIRGNNPGKGKFALVGGFCDVNGIHFDTAAETIIKEGKEEIGLKIVPAKSFEESIACVPYLNQIPVIVYLGKKIVSKTGMHLLGTFQTTDEEIVDKYKRVYQTTAYLVNVGVDGELNEEIIQSWFKAQDDAVGLIVTKIGDGILPEFGIGHHSKIFDSAISKFNSPSFELENSIVMDLVEW